LQGNIIQSVPDAIDGDIDACDGACGALAQRHSDCSSHAQASDLGWFAPGQMQKPCEDPAYAVGVDGISGVVETDSGINLIMRTG
jgi:NIMA-interacting peptidyl-prolyl cis-trans isomerase 1